MSSARNHAKRSHRSEHARRSCINGSARKMYIRQARKPQRLSLFERLFHRGSYRNQETI